MKGLLHLAWRHLRHHPGRGGVLIATLAVPIFLPLGTEVLARRYEAGLRARAATTPFVVGAKGSRFDLVLGALHFREVRLEPFRYEEYERLAATGEGLAIPLNLAFRARGEPIVGTDPDYFARRGLRIARGRPAVRLGECVLGAELAERLELDVGDAIWSDQRELYDISKPPALKLWVRGVLARSESPDDAALFVDLKTTWALAGLAHGHVDVNAPDFDPALVLARDETRVVASNALIEDQEITPEAAGRFHFHGARDAMPLSAVLFFPRDDKSGTLARSRVNRGGALQMVSPAGIVDELLAFVLRIERAVDALLGVLALCTLALVALVFALSTRLRAGEMRTLRRIGAAPSVSLRLHALELGFLFVASLLVALAATWVLALWLPDAALVLAG